MRPGGTPDGTRHFQSPQVFFIEAHQTALQNLHILLLEGLCVMMLALQEGWATVVRAAAAQATWCLRDSRGEG
jgi:hypothetical protein